MKKEPFIAYKGKDVYDYKLTFEKIFKLTDTNFQSAQHYLITSKNQTLSTFD